MTLSRTAWALVACGLAMSVPVVAQFGGGRVRQLAIRAADGRTVTAFQIEAAARPAPAVILVPMLGRPKEDWQALAERLADANITALAIDLPGTALPVEPAEASAWSGVVHAAVEHLVSRPEVRGAAIGLVGASLGANLAAAAAGSDERVRSLALVSPSLDYRGVRIEAPLKQYAPRPLFLLASRADPYAARTVRELGSSGHAEVHLSDTPAHGTVLLAREPELLGILVNWFQRTLPILPL